MKHSENGTAPVAVVSETTGAAPVTVASQTTGPAPVAIASQTAGPARVAVASQTTGAAPVTVASQTTGPAPVTVASQTMEAATMTVEATRLPPPQRGIIRQVELWPLRIPLRGALQIAVGEKRQFLDVVIVRLVTEEGVYGVGETQAWRRQGSSETLVGLIDAMQTLLIPQMIGQSVFDLAAIAARFDEVLYGRLAAKAALLDALYDAQGHLLGVPVWQLLGGRARESIEIGAVLTLRAQLEDTLDEALAFYQQGYRHFSIKVGLDIRRDIKAVSALRHALGDEARLLVDANAALAFDDARRLLHGIAPFAIDAAEQPLALHDRQGLAALAATSPVALILDESITTQADLLQWIPERSAHALHTKTAKNGGIWHSRPLWQLAHAAGWQVRAGNHPATSLATLAVAHLATAWPHTLIPSLFTQSVTHDLVADVVTEPVRVDNARLRLGTAPGWGVELDMAQIARWQRR